MDKSRIAEWILSLVLPPDRAASTVGDWMEDAERGDLWFWSCVFRTVFLCVGKDFAEAPRVLFVTWALNGYLAREFSWSWPMPPAHIGPVIVSLIALLVIGCAQFWTGTSVARHPPGKEVAAGISVCVMPAIVLFLLQFVAVHFCGAWTEHFITKYLVDPAVRTWPFIPGEIFLVAGILWARRQSMRRVTP